MSSELDNISYLSRKYFKEVKKITTPLRDKFGVTYFARQTVSNNGCWEILGNLPAWLDHSAERGFYKIDPSLLHPDHYQSGLTVVSLHSVPDFLKEMASECLRLFGIDHTLCILNKTVLGSEWYFFATSSENKNIINTYITQIHSIYNYVKYFNHEAKNILHQNMDFRIKLSNLKKEPFNTSGHSIDLAPHSFGDEGIITLKDYKISARERDCLSCLVRGKTIKETAKLLAISPRTVEEYFNRLRQKTGCKYKRELIACFNAFLIKE